MNLVAGCSPRKVKVKLASQYISPRHTSNLCHLFLLMDYQLTKKAQKADSIPLSRLKSGLTFARSYDRIMEVAYHICHYRGIEIKVLEKLVSRTSFFRVLHTNPITKHYCVQGVFNSSSLKRRYKGIQQVSAYGFLILHPPPSPYLL